MTQDLVSSVAQIARHCCKTHHWIKTPKGPRHVKEPLKFTHLEKHVGGGAGVGLAPVAPGESTTKIAVLDFDSHKGEVSWDAMCAAVKPVLAALRAQHLEPIPFRSSGGKGIHLIMLWDEHQDAYSARGALTAALLACNLVSGTKGVKHGEVEIFPKQDAVPRDGFGSMFILPLTGESLPLDPTTLGLETYEYAEAATWPKSRPVPAVPKPLPTVQPSSTLSLPLETSLAEIRSALQAIPNEDKDALDYEAWRNIVFAIHHGTNGSDEGLALAHEFSARNSKYDAEFLDARVWPHIRTDREGKTITVRSLFSKAREHENPADDFDVLPPVEEAPPPTSETGVAPPAAGPRFRLIPAGEFSRRPAPDWIVQGVIPDAELMVVFGESGSGKSFWVLDLIAITCQGKPWRDCLAAPYRAAYIAAEAAGGFRNRLMAYGTHHEIDLERLPLWVVEQAPNFLKTGDVHELVLELNKLKPIDVLVVDTFAQVTPGANENAGEDVGRALANCRALHRATGAIVVLIHHAGKDLTKGARGWSGLRAAADAEIEISRTGEERLATITKQKDGSDGRKYPFRLTVVPIGERSDGTVIDSCVVAHQERQVRTARAPTGANELLVWKAIHDIAELCGDVTVAAAIEEAAKHKPQVPGERDQRRQKLLRALEGLAKDGLVQINNDQILISQ